MSDMVAAILTVAAEGPDGERVPAGQPLVMTANRAERFRARGYLAEILDAAPSHEEETSANEVRPAEPVALEGNDQSPPSRRRQKR